MRCDDDPYAKVLQCDCRPPAQTIDYHYCMHLAAVNSQSAAPCRAAPDPARLLGAVRARPPLGEDDGGAEGEHEQASVAIRLRQSGEEAAAGADKLLHSGGEHGQEVRQEGMQPGSGADERHARREQEDLERDEGPEHGLR